MLLTKGASWSLRKLTDEWSSVLLTKGASQSPKLLDEWSSVFLTLDFWWEKICPVMRPLWGDTRSKLPWYKARTHRAAYTHHTFPWTRPHLSTDLVIKGVHTRPSIPACWLVRPPPPPHPPTQLQPFLPFFLYASTYTRRLSEPSLIPAVPLNKPNHIPCMELHMRWQHDCILGVLIFTHHCSVSLWHTTSSVQMNTVMCLPIAVLRSQSYNPDTKHVLLQWWFGSTCSHRFWWWGLRMTRPNAAGIHALNLCPL